MTNPDVRFLLANERTFLAWQRTAVGLVAGALAVLQLIEPSALSHVLAAVLLVAATLASGGGWWRYRRTNVAIRTEADMPGDHMVHVFAVAVLVAVAVVAVSVAL